MAEGKKSVPCRLTCLLARDVPRAVILRRGPTRRVQLILWHTDTDLFEEGQWFHGRIYEQGSDLSPDGSSFLYLARKAETPGRRASRLTHKWTAVSRPPYFTALHLWPAGDTWDGGGMFLENNAIWLCYGGKGSKQLQTKNFRIQTSYNPGRFLEKSKRDGWQLTQKGQFSFERVPDNVSWSGGLRARAVTQKPFIWRRDHVGGRYSLIKEVYREPDFSFLSLIYLLDQVTGEQELIEDTTWIDWDQQGRLVLARGGKLFASSTNPELPLHLQQIADFTANVPSAVIAPYQGKHW